MNLEIIGILAFSGILGDFNNLTIFKMFFSLNLAVEKAVLKSDKHNFKKENIFQAVKLVLFSAMTQSQKVQNYKGFFQVDQQPPVPLDIDQGQLRRSAKVGKKKFASLNLDNF